MSNIWFTSDNHFYHKNIQKFCPTTRMGSSVQEMNELLIRNHNSVVGQSDTVYFLGDFSFGTTDETFNVLQRLNGKKHLIFGNHDKVIRNQISIQKQFESCQDYLKISIAKQKVVMFHYPILEWESMHHGAYHLFGHVHGNMMQHPHGRSMDVGIDARPSGDMMPWNWDEINRILSKREVLKHHKKDV